MTDTDIIQLIRSGKIDAAVRELYKDFSKIKLLLIKEGGKEEWVQEIFNDSLVLLIEKVQNPSFELTSKLSTYLTGINRFMLKNELRRVQKHSKQFPSHEDIQIPDSIESSFDLEKENKLKAMEFVLRELNQKCQDILHLFYVEKARMIEIANRLGFSSEKSAKTQKYKCLEKAHKLAKKMMLNQNSELV